MFWSSVHVVTRVLEIPKVPNPKFAATAITIVFPVVTLPLPLLGEQTSLCVEVLFVCPDCT